MHGFVNPDLPKRVGIKKFSSAIKVGIYMEFALFIKRRLQEGTPCLLLNLIKTFQHCRGQALFGRELDGIGVARIRRFPVSCDCAYDLLKTKERS